MLVYLSYRLSSYMRSKLISWDSVHLLLERKSRHVSFFPSDCMCLFVSLKVLLIVVLLITLCFFNQNVFLSDNSDITEAKQFFESNYSHIYYIFYDVFIITENNLKQRGKLLFHYLKSKLNLLATYNNFYMSYRSPSK